MSTVTALLTTMLGAGNIPAELDAWLHSSSPCPAAPVYPYLVGCTAAGQVDALNFSSLPVLSNLAVPAAITTLTALTSLDMSGLSLMGTMPSMLSALKQLQILDVSDNYLTVCAGWYVTEGADVAGWVDGQMAGGGSGSKVFPL